MRCDLLDAYREEQTPIKVAAEEYEGTLLLAILGLGRTSGREVHWEVVDELPCLPESREIKVRVVASVSHLLSESYEESEPVNSRAKDIISESTIKTHI